MTRLLCTADLHLHEWAGLAPVDRLHDQEHVLDQVVELAVDRGVDAVLIAGDVFHRPHPSPRVLDVFGRFARALRTADIEVLAIAGNASHDIVNADEYAALELFDGMIDVRRVPGVWQGPGVQVACLPSVPVSGLVARVNGGADRDQLNQEAALLLLETARELRAQIPYGPQAVLVAHWSVSGAAFPNGLPVDAAREPVLELAELERLGFDAVVLGHIHKPQLLESSIGRAPGPIFYTGSPLPLDFGEAGSDHGVWILDFDSVPEFVPLDSRTFKTVDLDLAALAVDGIDAVGEFAGVLTAAAWPDVDEAIVRVRYRATGEQARRLDNVALKQAIMDAGAARVVVQMDIVRDDRARVEGLDEQLGELDAVGLWVDAQQLDEGQAESLRALTTSYLEGT